MSIDKGCLRCCVKHLLKAKGYLDESVSFGGVYDVSAIDIDKITLELVTFLIQKNEKK